ncbi:hypothetical protein [Fretibacterium fastidiosum]|uniref:hypothetical protein n=1 Tax=Fretibacterium fastidiosum TaxID=651822 RepID=UPI001FB10936|nr:hypothetical protein [Fretibacterium fastidiosum]
MASAGEILARRASIPATDAPTLANTRASSRSLPTASILRSSSSATASVSAVRHAGLLALRMTTSTPFRVVVVTISCVWAGAFVPAFTSSAP